MEKRKFFVMELAHDDFFLMEEKEDKPVLIARKDNMSQIVFEFAKEVGHELKIEEYSKDWLARYFSKD